MMRVTGYLVLKIWVPGKWLKFSKENMYWGIFRNRVSCAKDLGTWEMAKIL